METQKIPNSQSNLDKEKWNWKNQYCGYDYTAQSNLSGSIKLGHAKNCTRLSAIPIKLPMVFFTEQEQKFHNLYGNTKDPEQPKSHEKGKQSWNNQPSWLQTILQSYRHEDCMVLTQEQKYKPMEQERKPRDKPIHI